MLIRRCAFLGLFALATLLCGCGTVGNLMAPHSTSAASHERPWSCKPFGGVQTSVKGATVLAFEVGNVPLAMMSTLDVPFSLVGDVVTLPVAYARQQGAPWATWWGVQQDPFSEMYPQPMRSDEKEMTSTIPEAVGVSSWTQVDHPTSRERR